VGNGSVCRYPTYRETLPNGRSYLAIDQIDGGSGDDFGPVKVPPGRLFLMGDNRDDSEDSRFSLDQGGIGLVPLDRLVGRAAFAFWSTDGSASYWKPWTWFSALRFNRIGTTYQP
jgi:signal peptidase I